MQTRVPVVAAIAIFAVLAAGLALVVASDDDELPRLPFAATTAQRDMAAASSAAATAEAMPAPYFAEYKAAKPLAKPAEQAAAYRLDAATEKDAARLAKAFDVKGEVKAQEGDNGWVVTDDAHSLQVDRRSGNWFVSQGRLDEDKGVASASATATITACSPCPPDRMCAQLCKPEPERPAGMPSKADAERQARAIWAKAGIAPGQAKVDVEDVFSVINVRFSVLVDGTEVDGLGNAIGIGPNGVVQYASGHVGGFDKIGDYPLIDPDDALKRLNSSFGRPVAVAEPFPVPRIQPVPLPTDTVPPIDVPTVEPVPCGPPPTIVEDGASWGCDSGSTGSGSTGSGGGIIVPQPPEIVPVPRPVPAPTLPPEPTIPEKRVIEVTGVRLGLQAIGTYLLPVYWFSIGDGGETPPVPAVPDRYLQRIDGIDTDATGGQGVEVKAGR